MRGFVFPAVLLSMAMVSAVVVPLAYKAWLFTQATQFSIQYVQERFKTRQVIGQASYFLTSLLKNSDWQALNSLPGYYQHVPLSHGSPVVTPEQRQLYQRFYAKFWLEENSFPFHQNASDSRLIIEYLGITEESKPSISQTLNFRITGFTRPDDAEAYFAQGFFKYRVSQSKRHRSISLIEAFIVDGI